MRKIAITFLTCDRTEFTLKTLQTLKQFNDLSKFILIHADDSSLDSTGSDFARLLGFKTIQHQCHLRRGVAAMTELLFKKAAQEGADLILNLQNDWQCMRQLSLDDVDEIFDDKSVYCMRLYGRLKSHHGRCGIHHGGRQPLKIVEWAKYKDGYEIGDIHWGHPPSITRVDHALKLVSGASCESESRARSGKITDMTVRVVDNVFNHIGTERTKGFKS